mgnify:CR=1 FL=1
MISQKYFCDSAAIGILEKNTNKIVWKGWSRESHSDDQKQKWHRDETNKERDSKKRVKKSTLQLLEECQNKQEYIYIYRFLTFPVLRITLPAWIRVHQQDIQTQKYRGTKVLVPRHQNSGASSRIPTVFRCASISWFDVDSKWVIHLFYS